MSKYPDITGQRFGMLVVLKQTESDSRRQRQWICQCDCGIQCVVPTYLLTSHQKKSCGCTHNKDLTGQRFGKLTVLERSDRYAPRGKLKIPLWKCLCDCGTITYKATNILTNPAVSMCASCAEKYAAEKMRENAGFVDGTQLAKIRDMKPSAANTSGVRGVHYVKSSDSWRAMIYFQNKAHYLGTYRRKEDAIKARKAAEEEIFGAFLDEYDKNDSSIE